MRSKNADRTDLPTDQNNKVDSKKVNARGHSSVGRGGLSILAEWVGASVWFVCLFFGAASKRIYLSKGISWHNLTCRLNNLPLSLPIDGISDLGGQPEGR